MEILGKLQYRREVFRHGGTEILRMETLAPEPLFTGGKQDGTTEKTPQNGLKNKQKRRRKSTPAAGHSKETPAARHLSAMVCALEDFVRETVVPEAEAALDAAVAAGCGYRFARYLCRIVCEEKTQRGKIALTLHFLITSGGQTRHEAKSESLWEADGSLQCRPPRRRVFPRPKIRTPARTAQKASKKTDPHPHTGENAAG